MSPNRGVPAPLLSTKLRVPHTQPEIVHRPRLIKLLNEGLNSKLILISAPAGYGKTTILVDWIQQQNYPTAWLSLDERDNDSVRYMTYLVSAIQAIRPGLGESSLSILQTSSLETPELVLKPLVNDLADIAQPLLLVLEDYHLIHAQAVHEVTIFLLEHLPSQAHLVIVTRADPPFPIARLRGHNLLTELRLNDLCFTVDEAARFLEMALRLELPAEDVAALNTRTEGWVVGLQMAALSMRGRDRFSDFIASFSGSHRYITDFLIEEVLNQQPAQLKDFLLRTSILERLTAPLCDAVLDRSEWSRTVPEGRSGPSDGLTESLDLKSSQQILNYLERANLFLTPLDDERRWYRYHHLFRNLLRSSLESLYPGETPVLHRRASQWYGTTGMYEDAILHAFAAKDAGLAAGLIEQAARHLDIQNKLVTIARWIERLPDELIRARPWLCVYRAWGYYWMGQREQVENWCQAAEVALQATTNLFGAKGDLSQKPILTEADRQHIAGHIAAIRSHSSLTNEDIPGVLENSRKALELLPEGDDMRCETAVALGGAYWALGDVTAAEQAFGMARANALKCGNSSMVVPATCYVGMQQTKQGRLYDAMTTYRDALQYATGSGGKESPVAGFPNIKIGDLMREWNDLEIASQHLTRGVEQCLLLGQADVLTDGYVGLARLQIASGDMQSAHETLQRAGQVTGRTKIDPFIQCWLDDCRLRFWLTKGDLNAAVLWAKASGLRLDGELSYHYDLNHINLARVLVAQGRHDPDRAPLGDALGLLERLLVAAEKAGWIQEQIKILILQALAHNAQGDGRGALSTLMSALRLAEPDGYVRIFIDEGEEMRRLIEDCRSKMEKGKPALNAYLARLLGELSDKQAAAAHQLTIDYLKKAIGEPLTDREVEVLRLLATSMTSTEIATELYIATSTARTHIKNIYSKLSVNRRMEAVHRAKELGVI